MKEVSTPKQGGAVEQDYVGGFIEGIALHLNKEGLRRVHYNWSISDRATVVWDENVVEAVRDTIRNCLTNKQYAEAIRYIDEQCKQCINQMNIPYISIPGWIDYTFRRIANVLYSMAQRDDNYCIRGFLTENERWFGVRRETLLCVRAQLIVLLREK